MVIARIRVHLGIPCLQKQSFMIIFHSTNYYSILKLSPYGVYISLRVELFWNSCHYAGRLFYVILF